MEDLLNLRPHSVCFLVSDLDGMAAWYRETLGFAEGMRRPDLVFMQLHGFSIELVVTAGGGEGERNPDPPARRETSGFSHFALETDDLAGLEKELVRKGVQTMFPFDAGEAGFKFLFIRDLEGNLIQLMQFTKKH